MFCTLLVTLYWLLVSGYLPTYYLLCIIYYLLPFSIYYKEVYQLWVTGPRLAGVTCSPKEVYKSEKITKIADRGKQKWLPRHVGVGLPQPYSQAKSWFLIERCAEIVVIIRSARLVGGRGSFFRLCRSRVVLLTPLGPWKQKGNSRWKPCGSVFRGPVPGLGGSYVQSRENGMARTGRWSAEGLGLRWSAKHSWGEGWRNFCHSAIPPH